MDIPQAGVLYPESSVIYSGSFCSYQQASVLWIAKLVLMSIKRQSLLTLSHRVIEWLRLEGLFRGPVVQTSCSSKATYSQLPRTISRCLLNIFKEGASTTSLCNLCLCSVTLTIKKVLLLMIWNLLVLGLAGIGLIFTSSQEETQPWRLPKLDK